VSALVPVGLTSEAYCISGSSGPRKDPQSVKLLHCKDQSQLFAAGSFLPGHSFVRSGVYNTSYTLMKKSCPDARNYASQA
jgi:hypothetical protein